MIASFLFAALAGLAVKHSEPFLESLMAQILRSDPPLDSLDFRLLTFSVMLAVAAVATALVGGDASLFLGATGGALGYFGPRIYAFLRDPDGAMGDPDDDWDGRTRFTPAEPDRDEATLAAVRDEIDRGMRPERPAHADRPR